MRYLMFSETFFELLEYKTNVIKVNTSYTSQKYNSCGSTNKESRKRQSVFECVAFGYAYNADLNATNNTIGERVISPGM